jgi:beta-alanine--pyruvate transaminase
LMTLKGLPNVLDIRCLGLTGAIDLAPSSAGGGARGYKAVEHSIHEAGIMIRISGDTIELTPPLIISENQIGEIVDKVGQTIKAVA